MALTDFFDDWGGAGGTSVEHCTGGLGGQGEVQHLVLPVSPAGEGAREAHAPSAGMEE
ncbi:hypothetical protein [Streptomyces sp. NPDC055287]